MYFKRIFSRRPKGLAILKPVALALLVIAMLTIPASATDPPAPPSAINYQGYLTDAGGNPIDGNMDMTFTIYDSFTGGSSVWTEDQEVFVNTGLFNVLLGKNNPISADLLAGDRYLGVQVGADPEMEPRQQLVSVAYSLRSDLANRASDADTLDGMDSAAFAPAGHVHPPDPGAEIQGAPYRWAVFSTYNDGDNAAWFANNDASLFGGVQPQKWSDDWGKASQMSADKEVLRTLFTQKGYGGKNALVFADEWLGYSTTNSKLCVALFRIKNTTASPIEWPVYCYMTANYNWGELASIAVNGADTWHSTSNLFPHDLLIHTLSIPANRTSTVIFVSPSSWGKDISGIYVYVRASILAFTNNCLDLPEGLEYVDDLDVATGGWEQ